MGGSQDQARSASALPLQNCLDLQKIPSPAKFQPAILDSQPDLRGYQKALGFISPGVLLQVSSPYLLMENEENKIHRTLLKEGGRSHIHG